MRLLAALVLAPLAPLAAFAAQGWPTDLEAAKKQAAAEKKDILVLFTGSDWCAWSQRLDREVLDTVEFGGQKRFVLVLADFPQQTQVPAALEKRNRELKEAWSVSGFPTVVLATSDGEPYAKIGYKPGGPAEYLRRLEFLAKRSSPEGVAIFRETPRQTEAREAAHKEKLYSLMGEGDFEACCRQIDSHLIYDDGGIVLIPFNKAVVSHAIDPKATARSLPYIDQAIEEAEKSGPPLLVTRFRMKRAEILRGE